ncbi:hypothetical protein Droror1_Dr00012954 [Drosera rotundifolia]
MRTDVIAAVLSSHSRVLETPRRRRQISWDYGPAFGFINWASTMHKGGEKKQSKGPCMGGLLGIMSWANGEQGRVLGHTIRWAGSRKCVGPNYEMGRFFIYFFRNGWAY